MLVDTQAMEVLNNSLRDALVFDHKKCHEQRVDSN